MAHYRRAVGAATLVNTAIFIGEAGAGMHSHSLSLMIDSVHNFSDELALICLYAAFRLPGSLGRQSQRTANLLNSVGLIAVSALLGWQSLERLAHIVPVSGLLPALGGLAAAVANWGVAGLLRAPARTNAAVRLAYIHNLGDIVVSLVPVAAGLLVMLTGRPAFDALLALGTALWLMASTIRSLRTSREELLWPEVMTCGHEMDRLTAGAR